MQHSDLIYVAGHTGLIGSAFVAELQSKGFNNIICLTHEELDLTCQSKVDLFFEKYAPKFVVLAAGQVRGVLLKIRLSQLTLST